MQSIVYCDLYRSDNRDEVTLEIIIMKNEIITENTMIVKNNAGLFAAAKINGGNVFNSRSWVSKQTAIKRAKMLQADINDGFIKA